VIVAGQDGSAHLLRAADAALVLSLPCARCPLLTAALSPDETRAAVGTRGGEVVLLEVPSGRILARLTGHTDAVTTLAFAGDALLASGSRDRTVRLAAWDGETARPLFALPVGGPVRKLAFLAGDPRLAVLVHNERAVRLWHLDRLWPKLDALAPADPLPPLPRTEPPAAPAPPLPPPAVEEPARGPNGSRAKK
jgi:WD40 repeat protein